MMWKCSVCGFTNLGEEALEKCPKCKSPKESFLLPLGTEAQKIINSNRTNDIHMEINNLAMKIRELAKEGIDINLDVPCVELFTKAYNETLIIKQRSKAEITCHVGKGKW